MQEHEVKSFINSLSEDNLKVFNAVYEVMKDKISNVYLTNSKNELYKKSLIIPYYKTIVKSKYHQLILSTFEILELQKKQKESYEKLIISVIHEAKKESA